MKRIFLLLIIYCLSIISCSKEWSPVMLQIIDTTDTKKNPIDTSSVIPNDTTNKVVDSNAVFLEFKNFSLTFSNIHCIYYKYQYYSHYPDNPSVSKDTIELFNYKLLYKFTVDSVKQESRNVFILKKDYSLNPFRSELSYEVNRKYHVISTLDLYVYELLQYNSPGYEWQTKELSVEDVPYQLINDSLIKIEIKGSSLVNYINNLKYTNESTCSLGHQYSESSEGIYKYLAPTDSSSLTIILSK